MGCGLGYLALDFVLQRQAAPDAESKGHKDDACSAQSFDMNAHVLSESNARANLERHWTRYFKDLEETVLCQALQL